MDQKHPALAQLVGHSGMFAPADNKGLMTQRNGHGHIRVYAGMRVPETWISASGFDTTHPKKARTWLFDQFAGRVRGMARLVESMKEAMRLSPGEILVTRGTDPRWTPVFPLVSALVLETGGMLSHGAIIAREYGVPAVILRIFALLLVEIRQIVERAYYNILPSYKTLTSSVNGFSLSFLDFYSLSTNQLASLPPNHPLYIKYPQ